MHQLHAGAAQVVGDDRIGSGVRLEVLGLGLGAVLGLEAFALVDVEDGEGFQQGDLLHLSGLLFVVDFKPFPEDYLRGFLSLLHPASLLGDLGERCVFTRLTKDKLIEEAVGLPGAAADSAGRAGDDPRLAPRDDPLLKLGDDAVSHLGVNIAFHVVSSL